jgi:hypothetical protein
MAVELRDFSWQRMIEAVQAVRERALRATAALEPPGGNPRDAVHLLFAGEKVRESYPLPTADVTERERADDYHVVALDALVRMKLNSFRDKDRMHLRDLIDLGLIDASWLPKCLPEHAALLQQLLDEPDG